MLSSPSKKRAIEVLRSLRDRAEPSAKAGSDSSEAEKWRRDCQGAFRNIFGEDSEQLKDLKSIDFTPAVLSTGRDNTGIFAQAFRSGVVRTKALIESCIDEVDTYWVDDTSVDSEDQVGRPDTSMVFVVHGRNQIVRDEFFGFLRSLGLKPMEWSQCVRLTSKGSPYIGEILDAAFKTAQAVVVLITPDDEARLRDGFVSKSDPPHETDLSGQARPNVLFEAGLAFGHHPDRTVLVQIGEVRPFSDIAGRHVVHLNNSAERRHELANRLESCGCAVDQRGTDWTKIGNFDSSQANQKQPGTVPSRSTNQDIAEPQDYDVSRLSPMAKALLVNMLYNGKQCKTVSHLDGIGEGVVVGETLQADEEDIQESALDYVLALDELLTEQLVQNTGISREACHYALTRNGSVLAAELRKATRNF